MNRAVLLLIFLLSSCSSTDTEPEATANEIPDKEIITVDLSQEELINNAKRAYAGQIYTIAIDSFQALRDGYSPGPYAEFAEIKLADCQFEGNEFDMAAGLYEEFIKNHPSSTAVPYALLRAGRSLELWNKGVGKNVAPLEKARDYYQRLNEQYPDSVYAGAARKYHAAVIQKLAEYEILVGEYYKRKENEKAYQARTENYDRTWQPLVDASLKVQEEKEEIPIVPPATEDPAIVGATRTSAVAVKRKVPSQAPLAEDEPRAAQRLASAEYRIQSIQCQRGGTPAMFIFLNKPLSNDEFLTRAARLEPSDQVITFQVPQCASKAFSANCFSDKDVSTSEDCKITIKSRDTLTTLALANPPRLLLTK